MKEDYYFEINTPLDVKIRTTKEYWEYIIKIKHRTMQGKEDVVKEVLIFPDEIRRSKIDEDIYLYYKKSDKIYCVVAKHTGRNGYLITAYPTDKVKEGEIVWTR